MPVLAKDIAQLMGIHPPWKVSKMTLAHREKEVRIHVAYEGDRELTCPRCDAVCPGYDHRRRKWRHLDRCAYQTMIWAEVPRVTCPKHGVRTVKVPWAEQKARYTAAFEALVIDGLQEASVSAVARLMGLSWNAVDGIMQRAVRRGLARRKERPVAQVGVDETSFRKRHNYVTLVSDTKTGTVLYVGEGRTKEALKDWYEQLTPDQLASIESISMDMWPAYINATLEHVPDAREKIAFDRFHVARCLADSRGQGPASGEPGLDEGRCARLKGDQVRRVD